MARFTFRLPDIGEGIAEAEIVAWHIAIGDMVEEDGRIADLMTDKATVEMESPVAGRVVELGGEVGQVVAIGSPLVVLETEGESGERLSAGSGRAGEGEDGGHVPQQTKIDETREEVEQEGLNDVTSSSAAPAASPARPEPVEGHAPLPARVLASPAVRKRAQDLGVDLAEIRSTQDGRIRHADLDAFLSYGAAQGYAPAGQARADEQVKVAGLRRRIAEAMAASKRQIPHFTYVEECDVTDLEQLRAQLNGGDRPRLTMLPLLITGLCRALPDFPMLNARYDDEAGIVTRHGAVHMGVATMTDAGLMVPVIRDAQGKNLWQLAAEILRLAEAARSGKARSEELSGSTFTISSLGPLGGIASTPIVNRPEVAIIAPNRIVERPAFVPDGMGGERIARRKLMNLSISCDHRVVDGQDAAAFVQQVKRLIEAPALLLAG